MERRRFVLPGIVPPLNQWTWRGVASVLGAVLIACAFWVVVWLYAFVFIMPGGGEGTGQ